jgi:hypothetical protein
MRNTRTVIAAILFCVGCLTPIALGSGDGDVYIHLYNTHTGPDTAAIGAWNTLEIWIANDDWLYGQNSEMVITFATDFYWNEGYGFCPPTYWPSDMHLVQAWHGKAVECWEYFMCNNGFDNVSPEYTTAGGASGTASGLPPGPLELCYSMQFYIPSGEDVVEEGVCVVPGDNWVFDDGSAYAPTFCGQYISDPYNPIADPVCFPIGRPEPPYVCGDANADGVANITDAVYLISYIFAGGPAPDPLAAGDVNCDGSANITDAVYLISYIFAGGPEPCDPDGNGEPDC